MMRNEILSALDHFHEENSRRITSSVKDLADAFIKLIPFKRRMDPEASPAKDEANAKEGEDKSNHSSVKCSKSKSKNQSDGSTVKVTSSGSNRTSPPQLMIEQHRRYLLRQNLQHPNLGLILHLFMISPNLLVVKVLCINKQSNKISLKAD